MDALDLRERIPIDSAVAVIDLDAGARDVETLLAQERNDDETDHGPRNEDDEEEKCEGRQPTKSEEKPHHRECDAERADPNEDLQHPPVIEAKFDRPLAQAPLEIRSGGIDGADRVFGRGPDIAVEVAVRVAARVIHARPIGKAGPGLKSSRFETSGYFTRVKASSARFKSDVLERSGTKILSSAPCG